MPHQTEIESDTENMNRVPVKTLKTQRLENDKQIGFFYHWLFLFFFLMKCIFSFQDRAEKKGLECLSNTNLKCGPCERLPDTVSLPQLPQSATESWQRVDPWPNRVPASEEPSFYHSSITNPPHLWGQLLLQHPVMLNRTFHSPPFSSWFQYQFLSPKTESMDGPARRWQRRRAGLQNPCNTWGTRWLLTNALLLKDPVSFSVRRGDMSLMFLPQRTVITLEGDVCI